MNDVDASIRLSSTDASSSSSSSSMLSFPLSMVLSMTSLHFSLWLPFAMPLFGISRAAQLTYVPASYAYDPTHTRFDNTIWTYGTDYALAFVMLILGISCHRGGTCRVASAAASGGTIAKMPTSSSSTNSTSSRGLRAYSFGLLLCYSISTLFGGYAHMNYVGVNELNASGFRLVWSVTVGFVSFASCFMGLIGREVQDAFGARGALPLGPW
jgi:hypothetical protein